MGILTNIKIIFLFWNSHEIIYSFKPIITERTNMEM